MDTRLVVIGYCYSCGHFRRWSRERPVVGVARFGRCRLGVVCPAGVQMCDRYQEATA